MLQPLKPVNLGPVLHRVDPAMRSSRTTRKSSLCSPLEKTSATKTIKKKKKIFFKWSLKSSINSTWNLKKKKKKSCSCSNAHHFSSSTVLPHCWRSSLYLRPCFYFLDVHTVRRQNSHHPLPELGVCLTPRQKTNDWDGHIIILSGLWRHPEDLKRTGNTQVPHLTPTDVLGRGPTGGRVQSSKYWG